MAVVADHDCRRVGLSLLVKGDVAALVGAGHAVSVVGVPQASLQLVLLLRDRGGRGGDGRESEGGDDAEEMHDCVVRVSRVSFLAVVVG